LLAGCTEPFWHAPIPKALVATDVAMIDMN
jgi:hypothetical protein